MISHVATSQPTNSYSQTVSMPSPEASSLGKYTDIPINYFTGIPEISIPIYEVKQGPISLPVSISYHASGIKVGEPASRIGSGWSINAGGVISRTILGIKDEDGNGYYFKGDSIPTPDTCYYHDYVENAFLFPTQYETEPDIFSFNVNGLSGKFYFNHDDTIPVVVTIPKQDIKILPIFGSNSTANDYLESFLIIDSNGNRYHFGKYNGQTALEYTQTDAGQILLTSWYLVQMTSSDGLNAIDFVYKEDDFEYAFRVPNRVESGGSLTYVQYGMNSYTSVKLDSITSNLDTLIFETGLGRLDVREHFNSLLDTSEVLDKIKVRSGGFEKEFIFHTSYYEDDVDPETGSLLEHVNYRLKLDSLSERSSNNAIVIPAYNFEYYTHPTNLDYFPNKMSRAIDHWGYYNGQSDNNNFPTTLNIPQTTSACINGGTCLPFFNTVGNSDRDSYEQFMLYGALKKITYPTGGFTEYEMEANNVYTQDTVVTRINYLTINHAYPYPGRCNTSTTYSNPDTISFTSVSDLRYCYDIRPSGTCNCTNIPGTIVEAEIIVRLASNGTQVGTTGPVQVNCQAGSSFLQDGTLLSLFSGLSNNVEYTFELEGTNCAAEFMIYENSTNPVFLNKDVGGLRIKSITQSDGQNINPDIITEFDYLNSGQLFHQPRYSHSFSWYPSGGSNCSPTNPCNQTWPPSGGCNNLFFETSVVPLGSFEGFHIGYEEVKEIRSDSAYKLFKFYIEPPFNNGSYIPDEDFPIEPHQARILTGKTKTTECYKYENGVHTKLKSEDPFPLNDMYEYSDERMIKVLPAPSGFFDNSYRIRTRPYRLLKNTVIIDSIETKTEFTYDTLSRHLFPVSETLINSDSIVFKTEYYYTVDYPDSQIRDSLISKNILLPFEIRKYADMVWVDGSKDSITFFSLSTGNYTSSPNNSHPRIHKKYRYETSWDKNGNHIIEGYDEKYSAGVYSVNTGQPSWFISPGWNLTIVEYNDGGMPIEWEYSNFIREYEYFPGTRLLKKLTNIDGTTISYTYDDLMRLSTVTDNCRNVKTTYDYHFANSSTDHNYVKTQLDYPSIAGSDLDILESYNYLDGLGRSVQEVRKDQAIPGVSDIVTIIQYDSIGRKHYESEPFEDSGNNGGYSDETGFDKTEFFYEASHLDRIRGLKLPSWYWSNTEYGFNTVGEVNGYEEKLLIKETQINPEGNKLITYKDRLGRTILQRQTDSLEILNHDTYYEYDNKNRVERIIPPGAGSTPNLQFCYTYYGTDLIRSKKVPDQDSIYFTYDNKDLLSYWQDGNLRSQSKGYAINYDEYGRIIKEGYSALSELPEYDDPVSVDTILIEKTYGLTIITLDKIVTEKNRLIKDTWINEIYYDYDACGRLGTVKENTLLNPVYDSNDPGLLTDYSYDGADNILTETGRYSYYNRIDTVENRYEYDFQGRLKNEYQSITGQPESQLSHYTYSVKDEIDTLNIGITGTNSLQINQYTYLPNRFLKGINVTPESNDLFELELYYDSPFDCGCCSGSSSCQSPEGRKDGNIVSLRWGHNPNTGSGFHKEVLNLFYDHLDRLKTSNYYSYTPNGGSNTIIANSIGRYDSQYTYDERGNLLSLSRKGGELQSDNTVLYNTIDSLSYAINTNCNTIKKITEYASDTTGYILKADTDYAYDLNGNTVFDPSRDADTKYNHLNLPDSVYVDTLGYILYVYDATGKMHQKLQVTNDTVMKRDYIGQIEYLNEDVELVHNAQGYTLKTNYCNPSYKLRLYDNEPVNRTYFAEDIISNRIISPADSIIYYADTLLLDHEFEVPLGSAFLADTIYQLCDTFPDIWLPVFILRDHLGNNRTTFSDVDGSGSISNDEILSIHNYYPFGMEMRHDSTHMNRSAFEYLFNGKECETSFDLGYYNYGARCMEPSIGRFISVDPMADAAPGWTPCRYAFNNPLKYIDPDGMYEWRVNSKTGEFERFGDKGGDTEQHIYWDDDKESSATLKGETIYVGEAALDRFSDGEFGYAISTTDLWSNVPDEYIGEYTVFDLKEREEARQAGGVKFESIQKQEAAGLARRDQIWNNKDYGAYLDNKYGSRAGLIMAYDTGLLGSMMPGGFNQAARAGHNALRGGASKARGFNPQFNSVAPQAKMSWNQFQKATKGQFKGPNSRRDAAAAYKKYKASFN